MKIGDLLIDESEIVESFVRASGPGGQNVNKVAIGGRIALRRAPLAEPARRRRDQADEARGLASDAGRRDRHFRAALLQPAAQSRGRARAARGADRQGAAARKAAAGDAADAGREGAPARREGTTRRDQGAEGEGRARSSAEPQRYPSSSFAEASGVLSRLNASTKPPRPSMRYTIEE